MGCTIVATGVIMFPRMGCTIAAENQACQAPVLFGIWTETVQLQMPRPLYVMEGGDLKTPGGTVITLAVIGVAPHSVSAARYVDGVWHPLVVPRGHSRP